MLQVEVQSLLNGGGRGHLLWGLAGLAATVQLLEARAWETAVVREVIMGDLFY